MCEGVGAVHWAQLGRWSLGQLGRTLWRQQCTATVTSATPISGPNTGTRLTRTAYLAVKQLHWELHLHDESRTGRDADNFLQCLPLTHLPVAGECSSKSTLQLSAGRSTTVAHDCWRGWGSALPPLNLHACTDGSHDSADCTSSWSVVPLGRWLESNYRTIPSDESTLTPSHVDGAALLGASMADSWRVPI